MCTIRRPVIANFYSKIAKLSNYKQLSCYQKSDLTQGWHEPCGVWVKQWDPLKIVHCVTFSTTHIAFLWFGCIFMVHREVRKEFFFALTNQMYTIFSAQLTPQSLSTKDIQLWHFRINVVNPTSQAIQPPSSLIWKFTHFSFHGSSNPDPGPEFWLWKKNLICLVLCLADFLRSLPSIIFQTQVHFSNVDLVINK